MFKKEWLTADYIILETGYCSRLFPDIEEYTRIMKEEVGVELVYIYDALWGEKIGKVEHEIVAGSANVFRPIGDKLHLGGYIVIQLDGDAKHKPMTYVNICIKAVEDFDLVYCGAYGLENLHEVYMVQAPGVGRLLVAEFDFESG